MLTETIGDLLPAAFAVALSPIPIVAVVLVLGTDRARTTGPAFALGWVLGLAVVSTVVIVVAGGADDPDSATATGVNWLQVAGGVGLLVLARRQWQKRPQAGEEPEMPAWMRAVDDLTPPRGLVLGLTLSAANPKNLVLTLAAAATIAQAGLEPADEMLAAAAFVVIGSATVAGAVLAFLVAPTRAAGPLGSLKQFMSDHNAVIMMVILILLGAKLLGDGLGAL